MLEDARIEEALFRLTEANLALGLTSEAQTAAAVLGHNYPSSDWYKEAYDLLQKAGLQPQVNAQSTLATAVTTKAIPASPNADPNKPVPPPKV